LKGIEELGNCKKDYSYYLQLQGLKYSKAINTLNFYFEGIKDCAYN
jgi:hypothetical protein